MDGRAALVTGGSSGIGLAIARALGEDGYGITLSARRPEKLEAAARDLSEAGIGHLFQIQKAALAETGIVLPSPVAGKA